MQTYHYLFEVILKDLPDMIELFLGIGRLRLLLGLLLLLLLPTGAITAFSVLVCATQGGDFFRRKGRMEALLGGKEEFVKC